MTTTDHLTDDLLSTLVDEQLSPAELQPAQAHLHGCPSCTERLAQLHEVTGLLRRLPEVEPPRDFSLGPRMIADPPNVIRLQRWYVATRAAAASLAAAFVFLTAGTVYLDMVSPRAAAVTASVAASNPFSTAAPAAPAIARDAASSGAAPAPTTAPAAAAPAARANAVPAASPAAKPAAAPAPAGAALSAQAPANAEQADQTAAATSVRALPTTPPTALPAPAPASVTTPAPAPPPDPAAPLRTAAIIAGLLSVLALLAALIVRHRIRRDQYVTLQ